MGGGGRGADSMSSRTAQYTQSPGCSHAAGEIKTVFLYGTRLLAFHQLAVCEVEHVDGALPQHQVTGTFEAGVVAVGTFLSIAFLQFHFW